MEQKVIITASAFDVNQEIQRGWEVVSVTAQHVSNSSSSSYSEKGQFCFVLKRDKK